MSYGIPAGLDTDGKEHRESRLLVPKLARNGRMIAAEFKVFKVIYFTRVENGGINDPLLSHAHMSRMSHTFIVVIQRARRRRI